jgi:hypothetical protein
MNSSTLEMSFFSTKRHLVWKKYSIKMVYNSNIDMKYRRENLNINSKSNHSQKTLHKTIREKNLKVQNHLLVVLFMKGIH